MLSKAQEMTRVPLNQETLVCPSSPRSSPVEITKSAEDKVELGRPEGRYASAYLIGCLCILLDTWSSYTHIKYGVFTRKFSFRTECVFVMVTIGRSSYASRDKIIHQGCPDRLRAYPQ